MNKRFFIEFIDVLGRRGKYGYFNDAQKLIDNFESIIKKQDIITVFINKEFCNINSKYIVSYRLEEEELLILKD
ncbi:hypothetical protein G6Z34_13645 [Clostridium perfringens]|uniref:Uncharacterized protein n=1 Tax=Clostridium perfringens TaxID=1502 RepID=A0AAP7BWE2_CLOPF|nr:hypothetical protein [Clostridium perfringens]NGU31130.1 hypothetical protein [Clostridium perfringens]